ncbi:hypothetical protein VPMS16_2247 [Vibrio sp. 16]|nr:hypothetical protein VPMS16_2247 [Vibrio sp. 16]
MAKHQAISVLNAVNQQAAILVKARPHVGVLVWKDAIQAHYRVTILAYAVLA